MLSRVRTIYPGSYNDMDIVTQIKCIHDAVFNAMINELEKNNINTNELRAQKMQVMNINISGRKVTIGNVCTRRHEQNSNAVKGVKS